MANGSTGGAQSRIVVELSANGVPKQFWGSKVVSKVYLPERHHREETKKANNKKKANYPCQ